MNRLGLTVAAVLYCISAARGQVCTPQWSTSFVYAASGVAIEDIVKYDHDDDGPDAPGFAICGPFGYINQVPASCVARWSAGQWHALGSGISVMGGGALAVTCLSVLDEDGSGPSAPSLFVGGSFNRAGGLPVNNIARWDGSTWSPLGLGVVGQTTFKVRCMTVFDDDSDGPRTPALYVGGEFILAGGSSANRIARWDGSTWSPLDTGVNGPVYALAVFDPDGEGGEPASLIVGGSFTAAGTTTVNGIARWDGFAWSGFGSGPGPSGLPVRAIASYDPDGTGPALPMLVAGGNGGTSNLPAPCISKWTGTAWVSLASFGSGPYVSNLRAFDEDEAGPGLPKLFVGTHSYAIAGVLGIIAAWNGTSWSSVAGGVPDTPRGELSVVTGLALIDDDGPGPRREGLFVAAYNSGVYSGVFRWGCRPRCTADLDNDYDVDLVDLAHLLTNFGAESASFEDGDIDGDATVSLSDLTCLLSEFGAHCD